MKYEEFNDKQKDAISSRNVNGKKNMIVSAGAGSGKTEVLTQRVLYFNKNKNFRLNEFLILTFTKLAAGEMKERIRKTLKEEGLEDANIVDTCDICTFDSYAFSIVKKYHYLLKLSPNIRIIDSSVISVQTRNIAKEIFEEYYKNEDKEFMKMIEAFCFKDDVELVNLAVRLHSKACLDIDFDDYINTFIEKYYEEKEIYTNIFEEEFNELKRYIDSLKYNVNYLPKVAISKDNPTFYNKEAESLFRKFLNSQTYSEYISNFPLNYKIAKSRKLNKVQKERISDFENICESIAKFIESHPKTEEEFYEMIEFNKGVANVLLKIVKELETRIQEYKKEHQIYEFNDIAKLALKLVRENKDVRNSIKNKLKMIMIDEYQDTSILQEKFIEQIQDDNVYMVGDIKQSIYRFRNARSDIFRDKYEKYKNDDGGVAIDLNANYRSRKEVLEDINYVFERIMSLECGGANYAKDHVIEYGNTAYLKSGDGGENKHTETILYDDVSYDKKSFTEANLIVKDIVNKINNQYKVFDKKTKGLRDCKFSDFCILMDRDTDFETYIKIFNQYHVPLFAESDENISSNEDIKVYSNILRLIKCIKNNDYTSNEFNHSFVSLARSFVFCYSDQKLYELAKNKDYCNDEIITKLKEIVLTNLDLPIYNLFLKIIFDIHIYDSFINVGQFNKHERYLDTFLEKFKEMSEVDYSLDDFLSYLEYVDEYQLKITLSSKGSSFDSVRIMNIHKSKGLEFSIVYFAGLSKSFNRRDLEKEYNVSEYIGLVLPPLNRKHKRLLKEYHAEKEIIEDTSEKIRLFYVDMTRTKEKMIFLVGCNPLELRLKEILKYLKPLYYYLDDTSISKDDKLKFLFEKFLNKEINYSSLIYACDKYDIRLSKKFVAKKTKLDKKLSYTHEKIVSELEEEEKIKEQLKDLFYKIEENFKEDVKETYGEMMQELNDEDKVNKEMEEILSKESKENYTLECLFNMYKDGMLSLLECDLAFEMLGKQLKEDIKSKSKENLKNIEWDDEKPYKIVKKYCKWNSIHNWVNYNKLKEILCMHISDNPDFSVNKYLYTKAITGEMSIENMDLLVPYKLSLTSLKKVLDVLGYKLKEDFNEIIKNYDDYIIEPFLFIDYMFDDEKLFMSEEELFTKIYGLYKNNEISKDEFDLLIYGNQNSTVKIPYKNVLEELIKIDINNYKNKEEQQSYISGYFNKKVSANFINYLKNHIPYTLNKEYLKIVDKEKEETINEIENYEKWLKTNPGEYDEYVPLVDYDKYYSYNQIEESINSDFNVYANIDYDNLNIFYSENILEYEEIVKLLLASYYNKEINIDTLEEYLDIVDYRLSEQFKNSSFEESKIIELKNVVEDISGRKFYNGFACKSFLGFYSPFINYRRFNKTYGDIEITSDYPDLKMEPIIHKKLIIKDLNINKEEIIINRSSKDLKLTASKKSIEFGNDLHFMMEVMNFKNPDYSIIKSEYFKDVIKRFLSSSIMNNVCKADVYKEYEFNDSKENVNGVIDLMLVYDDHIDIIDYKTKNIDDEGYDKQLNIYKKYINIRFNKPVNTYLYSLLTGDIKEVK